MCTHTVYTKKIIAENNTSIRNRPIYLPAIYLELTWLPSNQVVVDIPIRNLSSKELSDSYVCGRMIPQQWVQNLAGTILILEIVSQCK